MDAKKIIEENQKQEQNGPKQEDVLELTDEEIRDAVDFWVNDTKILI